MKMNMKHLTVVVLALVVAIGLGYFSWDRALKASEDDGTVTASEQQQTVEQASQPVEVVVPAATDAPEVKEAEAPAETGVPAETEAPVEAEAPVETEAPRDPNFEVEVKMLNDGDVYFGDTVKLQAVLTGETSANFTYQWQYDDGNGWKNISNETNAIYSFTVTEENSVYDYRVVVTGTAK